MFAHTIDKVVPRKTYLDWLLLAFLAGHVNVGGFLSCQRFVTHVTGFATLAGIEIFRLNFLGAIAILSVPAYFFAGVMVSGYLTEGNFARRVHGNRYAPVMGLVSAMLFLVAGLGTLKIFGTFGEPAQIQKDYLLLALLCGASGLQNAAITSASGSTIRTTHLTGLTTDMGLGWVRILWGNLDAPHRENERRANKLRVFTILSFIAGGAVGTFCYMWLSYLGFVVPACIAYYCAREAKGAVRPPPETKSAPIPRDPSG